ncbi:MAG: phage major capsid protein [SAR202 cluster bacterium]|nr:phage major capsid protein [SAR202 cluster bacterium]
MVDETTVADPVVELGSALRGAMDGVATAIRDSNEALRTLIDERLPARPADGTTWSTSGATQTSLHRLNPAPEAEPQRDTALLPGGERAARLSVYDRFDAMKWTRGDFEIAGIIYGATREAPNVSRIEPPEDFQRAWRHHLFETGQPLMVREGNRIRAMDTAETGYGLELIGAQYESELWAAARGQDPLLASIRSIPMTAPTTYIPTDGALPEMLLVAENTASNSSVYTTSKTASSRATLTAKKFTIQSMWSGELEQDSIIQFTPFIREKLQQSLAYFLPSAMYNGDTTNAATGNINLDDADPADTKHYLAFDGIRHYWLVDATGQGKDMAGAIDLTEILRARGKLMVMGDDVDDDTNNANWGAAVDDLMLVTDWTTYLSLQNNASFATVDKYGPGAAVLTGELGRIFGIRCFAPAYASKTEADGKAAEVESSNTKGQITLFNRRGFIRGERAGLSTYFARVQGRDQFLLELYTRQAFTRHGTGVAAGIYNITV